LNSICEVEKHSYHHRQLDSRTGTVQCFRYPYKESPILCCKITKKYFMLKMDAKLYVNGSKYVHHCK